MTDNRIALVATGKFLVGRSVRSIHAVVEELIRNAEKEIIIAVYKFGGKFSEFFELLEESASRGVKISLIVNRLHEHPAEIAKFFRKLESNYPQVKVYNFADQSGGDLHMKVIVADRVRAVVGSANLTWKGMVENYELGILVEGESAEKIASLIETLASVLE